MRNIALPSLKYLALLCCLSPLLSAVAAARTSRLEQQLQSRNAEAAAAEPISPAKDSDKRFFVIPVPIIDPTIGQGLALAGLYTFGAKVVRHGRYITFQMAEVAIPRPLFAEILHLIDGLRPAPLPP